MKFGRLPFFKPKLEFFNFYVKLFYFDKVMWKINIHIINIKIIIKLKM